MTRWSTFHTPSTLDDALRALKDSPEAVLLAGGTDLLLDLEQGRHPPAQTLIDISRIQELHRLEIERGYLLIGAAIPLAKLITSDLVIEQAPGLVEACRLIGGPQVRNVATLGGNVAHALPAGDGTIALLSLGAEANVVTRESQAWTPLSGLFRGPGTVTFDRKDAIIAALRIPIRGEGEGSAFRRVMRPQGVAIAILNMGVWLRCEGELIAAARIAVGPGGPTPFLAEQGAGLLVGKAPEPDLMMQVAQAIRTEAQFRTSRHRATKAYREHVTAALVNLAVPAAYARASGQPQEL